MIPFLLLASTLWLVRQVVKGAFFKPSLPREISKTVFGCTLEFTVCSLKKKIFDMNVEYCG
jgi:hypothetical protein